MAKESILSRFGKPLARVALCLLALAPAFASEEARSIRPLRDGWLVRQLETDKPDIAALGREIVSGGKSWLRARMPSQVHDVLLAHGLIPDPHVSKNAAASAWVGQKDWAYACTFPSPPRAGGPIFLRFGGLDTLAAAYLNGAHIGDFANMNREFEADVSGHLAPEGRSNILLIIFASPLRFIDQVKQPPEHVKVIPKFKYLRKSHSDFGSYLGAAPHSVKVGVFRDVSLDVRGKSWIEDVWVRTELDADHRRATLRARVETGGSPATLTWTLTDPAGREVARGTTTAQPGFTEAVAGISDPRLWWPRTHGRPDLYRLRLELSGGGRPLDGRAVNVGIRDIKTILSDPATGEKRFRFEVNGSPIYMRGACWAPVEGMTHCWRPERASRLLDLAELGNMNILRVWAEGYIPPQEFYDECDRRGILVWQDFMFGYGMHPSGDPAFDANCRAEIEGTIRALRNHPSLLLWVGGNENHMGTDFAGIQTSVGAELFRKIMPEAVARLDPGRHFHPSSPYGGRVPNWPLEGDWHDYTTLTFSPQASVPAFASEVGRASAPSLRSMRLFLSEDELWPKGYDPAVRVPGRPAWPPMWQYRSVGGSWDKVGPVERYPDPASPADLIRVLGTAHGEYLQERVERHRRGVPDGAPDGNRRNWGNMIWRLNDAWPILYWSAVDYYLEPKIPFYFLRRAYQPVLVSFERTPDTIAVWVVNDSPARAEGTLAVRRRRFNGEGRGELKTQVSLGPASSKRCLDLTDFGPISLREEYLEATFADSRATYLLTAERYLHLPRATLQVRPAGGGIEITTDVFARQVSLDMDGVTGAVFEDNFFDLSPGETRRIAVVEPAGGREILAGALNSAQVRFRMPETK